MDITPLDIAKQHLGLKETIGPESTPAILAMLKLDGDWPQDDSVPWCSAFVNYIFWLLNLERSGSLRARSWLLVGEPVDYADATPGFDIVILSRGGSLQPGPDVIDAPGHVGFFIGWKGGTIEILGGNQRDEVSILPYPKRRILGIRRVGI